MSFNIVALHNRKWISSREPKTIPTNQHITLLATEGSIWLAIELKSQHPFFICQNCGLLLSSQLFQRLTMSTWNTVNWHEKKSLTEAQMNSMRGHSWMLLCSSSWNAWTDLFVLLFCLFPYSNTWSNRTSCQAKSAHHQTAKSHGTSPKAFLHIIAHKGGSSPTAFLLC